MEKRFKVQNYKKSTDCAKKGTAEKTDSPTPIKTKNNEKSYFG